MKAQQSQANWLMIILGMAAIFAIGFVAIPAWRMSNSFAHTINNQVGQYKQNVNNQTGPSTGYNPTQP